MIVGSSQLFSLRMLCLQWDSIEMLRKVFITGLIIFVRPGSLLQIVVALASSLAFGFAAAWYRPYINGAANAFKVATEITLTLTLTFATMLRFDLSKEDVSADTVGAWLTLVNLIGPASGLVFGLVTSGLGFERELMPNDEDGEREEAVEEMKEEADEEADESHNPVHEDST